MNPIVTVIVPVYNVEALLKTCVDSIINQTYKNLDIILVDDGSTDKSGDLCDQYSCLDKRIRVFHNENSGLSEARNCGLNNMKGDYVSFVDSDDYIDLNFIDELMRSLLENNAQICCSNVYDINNEFLYTNIEALNNLEENNGLLSISCGKLYDTILFKKLRYEKGRNHEDEFIIHELIARSNYVCLNNKVFYHYIFRKDGLTLGKRTIKKHLDASVAFRNRLYFYIDYELFIKGAQWWRRSLGHTILSFNLIRCLSDFVLISKRLLLLLTDFVMIIFVGIKNRCLKKMLLKIIRN